MTVKVKYLSIYAFSPPNYVHEFLTSVRPESVPAYIKHHTQISDNTCFYHAVDLSRNVGSTYYDMQGDPISYDEFKTLKFLLQPNKA